MDLTVFANCSATKAVLKMNLELMKALARRSIHVDELRTLDTRGFIGWLRSIDLKLPLCEVQRDSVTWREYPQQAADVVDAAVVATDADKDKLAYLISLVN